MTDSPAIVKRYKWSGEECSFVGECNQWCMADVVVDAADYDKLLAANAALKADAARYRWLREHAHVVEQDGGWASHFVLPHIARHTDSPVPEYWLKCRSLDKGIDDSLEEHPSDIL